MSRYINPQPRYVDDRGQPLVGGKLFFYSAGTVTERDTYSDAGFTVPNTNPVILDANGRPQTNIFLNGAYKVVLKDALDNTIWEKDPVGGAIGVAAFDDWINDATYDIGDIVTGSDGYYYQSLTNGNIGLDPTIEVNDWQRVQFNKIWRNNVTYDVGDIVVGSDDVLYRSLSASNLNNDPTSDPVNWSSVKDYWGVANGVATLDSGGKVPSAQIPPIAITDVYVVADQAARLALDAQVGDIAVQQDVNIAYILQSVPASTNSNWVQLGAQGFGTAAFRDVGTASGNIPEYTANGLSGYGYGGLSQVLNSTTINSINYSAFISGVNSLSVWSGAGVGLHSQYSTQGAFQNWIAVGTGTHQFRYQNTSGIWSSTFTYASLEQEQTFTARKRFDANVGFGVTANGSTADGVGVQCLPIGYLQSVRDSGTVQLLQRNGTSGVISQFRNSAGTNVHQHESNGNYTANGDITAANYYPTASDERLKIKLRPVVINYRQVRALQSWVFRWKDHEALPESQRCKIEIGLIAQEVLKVFPPEEYPSLVIKKDDGFYTIDPDKILMMRVFAKVEPRIVTWSKDVKRWLWGE